MMKNVFVIVLLIGVGSVSYCQVNAQDSSMQVVGYWSIGEAQSYMISNERYKVKEGDTTDQELIKYDVDITIRDSTASSYLIEWVYKGYQIEGGSAFTKKMMSICEDIPILLRTDEFGGIQGVENWEQIRDAISRSADVLQNEFKDIPNIDVVVNSLKGLFESKEIIESRAIDEVRQFYSYHGGAYTLGEQLSGAMKVVNLYGGEPFDANMNVVLDEISEEDNYGTFRMSQTIAPDQIADASYEYLVKLMADMDGPKLNRADIPEVENRIVDVTSIHGTGWPLYSVQSKIVQGEGVLRFHQTTIELK